MKNYIIIFITILLALLWKNGNAQTNIKIGELAPEITISEWLDNIPKEKSFKNKYIVLDFWATWCKPCLASVPHLNKLHRKFSSDKVVFLALTDESPSVARKVFNKTDFQSIVATDEYSKTQINFGDGVQGLVYYPMTVLIDDQNVIRWYGSSSNLTDEVMNDFLTGKPINVKQHSQDKLLDKKQNYEFVKEEIHDINWWGKLYEDPNIEWLVDIVEIEKLETKKGPTLSFGNGAFRDSISIEELFNGLFPKIKFMIPENYLDKNYRFAYINRNLDSESNKILLDEILRKLELESETKEELGINYKVKISNENLLVKSNFDGFEGYKKETEKTIFFMKKTIRGMLDVLTEETDHLWTFNGKNKTKYQFVIDLESDESIIENLACYGLKVKTKSIPMETIYLKQLKVKR